MPNGLECISFASLAGDPRQRPGTRPVDRRPSVPVELGAVGGVRERRRAVVVRADQVQSRIQRVFHAQPATIQSRSDQRRLEVPTYVNEEMGYVRGFSNKGSGTTTGYLRR